MHSEALIALVRERETAYAATRKDRTWEWTQEKKDALEAKFGAELKTASLKYEEAVKPFEPDGRRSKLVSYVVSKYGIDLGRMKFVDKATGQ